MTEISTDTNEQAPSWLPQLRSRWWSLLLGFSLMGNLLVGGVIFGSNFRGEQYDRLMGASYVQLVPRNFLRDLPRQRRQEFLQIVRDSRDDLRGLRVQFESTGLKLADVLEKQTFSVDEVRATVNEFATGSQSLAAKGGEVVVKIVAALTPEERKLLAKAIRERDARAKRRKQN